MNHARIAEQALRHRNGMVSDSFNAGRFDPAEMAHIAVECGSPVVDTALREIGTAWRRASLPLDALTEPWSGTEVDEMFRTNAALLDSIDNIIRAVHREQFSRPRRRTISRSRAVGF